MGCGYSREFFRIHSPQVPLSISPPERDPQSAVGELGPHGHPGSFRDSPWCFPCRLGVATQQQSQPCLQRSPQASRCTIPDVHLFSTVPYMLNVTAVHPGGASSSLLAFVAERISECLSSLPLSTCSIPWLLPAAAPLPPPTSCFVPAASILWLCSRLTGFLSMPRGLCIASFLGFPGSLLQCWLLSEASPKVYH